MPPTPEPTTKAPRPYAKTEQVLTTVTPTTLARLDEYAAENEVSRAEAMRAFILDGLDRAARTAEGGIG